MIYRFFYIAVIASFSMLANAQDCPSELDKGIKLINKIDGYSLEFRPVDNSLVSRSRISQPIGEVEQRQMAYGLLTLKVENDGGKEIATHEADLTDLIQLDENNFWASKVVFSTQALDGSTIRSDHGHNRLEYLDSTTHHIGECQYDVWHLLLRRTTLTNLDGSEIELENSNTVFHARMVEFEVYWSPMLGITLTHTLPGNAFEPGEWIVFDKIQQLF
ncbi:hypothetical protein M0220_00340 [Halomonas qinghailakensis]|uniref:Uncharacterized protein n=1 Tax=Halomonas qinghailakensis TaxID=2937790 RepID=A0AA46YP27_9GAMM|nr:hypothetical protein [Halomonas sp. ZZQ-149]UYO74646.1 hypothetical protein M0220_00340 [Halomonas sp. ZZQ-149]